MISWNKEWKKPAIMQRWAFKRAIKLDKSEGPAYVLMAKIYAIADMGEGTLKP